MLTILPTATVSPAEASLRESERISNNALMLLRDATVFSFRSFWGSNTDAQLLVLGTNAVVMFQKHQATVVYLLAMGVDMDPADYTPPLPYHADSDGRIFLD